MRRLAIAGALALAACTAEAGHDDPVTHNNPYEDLPARLKSGKSLALNAQQIEAIKAVITASLKDPEAVRWGQAKAVISTLPSPPPAFSCPRLRAGTLRARLARFR